MGFPWLFQKGFPEHFPALVLMAEDRESWSSANKRCNCKGIPGPSRDVQRIPEGCQEAAGSYWVQQLGTEFSVYGIEKYK
jgi:hypothetical protein